jgi:nicotinamide phosphoribosyltransferase
MYPAGSEIVYSNFTPRSTKHSPIPKEFDDGKIVVFGYQSSVAQIVSLWNDTFFSVDKDVAITDILPIIKPFCGPMGSDDLERQLSTLWEIGYLPLVIKTLPEGVKTYPKIPHVTVRSEDGWDWLTNYIETMLSQDSWKMPTVATITNAYRRILKHYAEKTGGSISFVDWQIHDFSARGLSGHLDNAMVGAAHLTSSMGTDSLLGVQWLNHFYDGKSTFIGGSVPATEHSVMCMGTEAGEVETFKRLITELYPSGVVSIVSDTWDYWEVITHYAELLKSEILNRTPDDMGMAKVVFRPDSGDPVDIICGTAVPIKTLSDIERYFAKNPTTKVATFVKYAKLWDGSYDWLYSRGFVNVDNEIETHDIPEIVVSPEMKGSVRCLWDVFGGTVNDKGYRTLNPRVGLIYGDSITMKRANTILDRLEKLGFASDNIVFGVGSYSYQFLTRDTFGFAMKATWGQVDGVGRDLFKDPKTDDGTKKSARGLLRVELVDGEYVLFDQQDPSQEEGGELKTIYQNGNLMNLTTIAEIRSKLM